MSRVVFSMLCPECDDEIVDIEVEASSGSRTENFWGARVRVDESECEVDVLPPCDTCGEVTVSEDEVIDHYWMKVAG